MGADVIKIEQPGSGDEARIYGPGFVTDSDGHSTSESGFYISANRNKRSVSINLSKLEGSALAQRLIATSDVLIENFLPGTMARFGLGYEEMRSLNPRLVYCSLTGYGQSGPSSDRPGYDAVFQAHSGLMAVTGIPDGEPGAGPMRTGPSIIDITTGTNAAVAILAALLERERISGEGQYLDIALLDCAVALQSHSVQNYLLNEQQPPRMGTAGNGGHPARVFKARNTDIYISAGNQKIYERLCMAIGMPELVTDPRFLNNPLRFRNRKDWDALVEPVIALRGSRELLDALVEARVPAALVNGYEAVFDDPHVRFRGIRQTIAHPLADEPVPFVASPIRLSRTPPEYLRHPPLLGEHNAEILSGLLGLGADEIERLRRESVI